MVGDAGLDEEGAAEVPAQAAGHLVTVVIEVEEHEVRVFPDHVDAATQAFDAEQPGVVPVEFIAVSTPPGRGEREGLAVAAEVDVVDARAQQDLPAWIVVDDRVVTGGAVFLDDHRDRDHVAFGVVVVHVHEGEPTQILEVFPGCVEGLEIESVALGEAQFVQDEVRARAGVALDGNGAEDGVFEGGRVLEREDEYDDAERCQDYLSDVSVDHPLTIPLDHDGWPYLRLAAPRQGNTIAR